MLINDNRIISLSLRFVIKNIHNSSNAPENSANTPANTVCVKSSARLHMGFFDLNGALGRKFGSIGLSVETPAIKVFVTHSDAWQVTVSDDLDNALQQRALKMSQMLAERLQLNRALNIDIQQFVPSHAGLGSGTQLALTIGAAINRLFNLALSTTDIAQLTGRGNRSGIGIAAFDVGGLIVDGGRLNNTSASNSTPPLVAHYDFPEDWRVLLIFDPTAAGVHGDAEKVAFNTLPTFPESLAAHLCQQVLMKAMPAIAEQDLTAFGESIQALQAHTGDYFAPVQGGRYASALVSAALNALASNGVDCYGQSSWGPTGFAIFASDDEARKHLNQLLANDALAGLDFQLTKACNRGAVITTS